jgi:preprotein translocase subunit SecG|tara:strand:+ start:6409 stop:7137 length:729 start_codon:yes stop_codon:yes gene_type:complete
MKKSNFFWVGFADLMTSLFFIMLVLFIVTVVVLENKMKENVEIINNNKNIIEENEKLISELKENEKDLNIENEKLNKLLKIEEQFKPLENNSNFVYLNECKKFVASKLIGQEIFKPNEVLIKKEFINITLEAGKTLELFLSKLNDVNPTMSYLLVIEGNMANRFDKSINKDDEWGYKKSYQRALAVYKLWQVNSIDFRIYNVEVMICGSGFNGVCRDVVEENNKRFSIQIIPKTENINNKNI